MSSEKRKLVQKYLDKEMSDTEIKQFEEELKINPSLYEELLFNKEVDSAIKELIEENMFLNNLEKAHNSYLKTMKKGGRLNIFNKKFAFMPKEERPRIKPIVWYAAATIAVIFGSLLFFAIQSGKNTPEYLYAEYKAPYEITGVQRSASNTDKDIYQIALSYFEQKDYKTTLNYLDKLIKQGNVSSSVYYYKGLSLLEMDKAKEAIKNLLITANDKNCELQQEAEWYLGLAYLKAKDIENSKKQFKKIENLYPYYKTKAHEIFSKLN